MATNPKGNGQPAAAKAGALSGAPANAVSTEDRKLAIFVRANAQPIIACLLDAAATAGEARDYAKMHEWRQLGNDLANLSGGAGKPTPATTMAAGAGA